MDQDVASTPAETPVTVATPAPRAATRGVVGVLRWIAGRRLSGLLGAIVLTMLAFQAMNSYFLEPGNLLNLVRSATTLAIIGFGETLVLLTGEIDLSVGSTYGFTSMAIGLMWSGGVPIAVAIIVGIAFGAAVGVVNGLITTKLRVNSFITTLGMLNVIEGLTFLISGSLSLNPSTNQPGYDIFEAFGGATLPFGIPVQIAWLALVGVLAWVFVHRTLLGFQLAAIGGNPVAAKVVHLRIDASKILVFAISGMCAALAGLMDFSFVGSTGPTSGTSLPFTVFAAVIIGGASLAGGRGTIIGTLVGALFLSTITTGLALLGEGAFVQLLMVGFIIIAAVALDNWTSGRAGQGTQF